LTASNAKPHDPTAAANPAAEFDGSNDRGAQRPSPMQALFLCLHGSGNVPAFWRAVRGDRKVCRSSVRSVNRVPSATPIDSEGRTPIQPRSPTCAISTEPPSLRARPHPRRAHPSAALDQSRHQPRSTRRQPMPPHSSHRPHRASASACPKLHDELPALRCAPRRGCRRLCGAQAAPFRSLVGAVWLCRRRCVAGHGRARRAADQPCAESDDTVEAKAIRPSHVVCARTARSGRGLPGLWHTPLPNELECARYYTTFGEASAAQAGSAGAAFPAAHT